jgi:hypothetical protein
MQNNPATRAGFARRAETGKRLGSGNYIDAAARAAGRVQSEFHDLIFG